MLHSRAKISQTKGQQGKIAHNRVGGIGDHFLVGIMNPRLR